MLFCIVSAHTEVGVDHRSSCVVTSKKSEQLPENPSGYRNVGISGEVGVEGMVLTN